jgi:hypothetical protein
MSKKGCSTGACPIVNNKGAESDPGSDNTSRTGRTGGSERSNKSGHTHKSGGSERTGKSGRTHNSGGSGKSRKSGGERCEKKDEHAPSQKFQAGRA